MTGRIKKLTALALAALLLVSPLLETRLYAAEVSETPMTEEDIDKTEQETESSTSDNIAAEEESISEETSAAEEETESSTSDIAAEEETESGTSDNIAAEEESISAAESEADSESETEAAAEATEELMSEAPEEDNTETAPEAATDEYEYPCPDALEPENAPYDENQDAFTDKLVRSTRTRSEIPTRYDAREEGYLPSVRDQGSWGACWSFSLTGAMEASAIRDMGIATDEIDLSERHLAYFGYNTGYDALDNANGDTMTSPADYYLRNGGNDIRGVVRLMNWNGGAKEEDYPYVTGRLPDALERETAQDARIYLENAHRYNFADAIVDDTGAVDAEKKEAAIKVVKKMITDYGAVSWSYYSNSKYLNAATGAYYNSEGGPENEKTNHAIMAVGWDDDYPRENFRADNQPQNNGAWIIRNSWGKSTGDGGYYYMSYEDKSLGSGNAAYAVTVCDSTKYDNNYFYGNTAFSNTTIAARRAAQVFQIKSEKSVREKLTAVSFLIGTSSVDYELQIYKNPDMEDGVVVNPTSGTAMLDTPQKGTTGYAGLHTIALTTPVTLDADDYVSIVLTFPDTKPSMYFDRSYNSSDGSCKGQHVIARGQSFYGSSLTSWQDGYEDNRTFRINALTVDCDDVEETPEIKEISAIEARGFDQLPQITLRWSKCTDVDGYRIYRSEDNKNYVLAGTADRSKREYTDTLPERKTAQYFYKVEAVYGSRTEISTAVSQEIEDVIKMSILTLSAYDGCQAVFTWDSVSGADSYELWRLSNEKEIHVADFAAGDTLSYTVDMDGWEFGNYYYKVRAAQGGEYTDWSEACIHKDLTWSQTSYYRAQFEWLPVDGAASYKLYHKVNGKTFSVKVEKTSVLMSVNSTSYRPCDEHQYYVNAYDKAGSLISTSSTIVFQMLPDTLNIDSIVYDYENTVLITWSGGLGAERIAVYRSEASSEQGVLIAEVDADKDAAAVSYGDSVYKGKTYWYSCVPIAVKTDGGLVEGAPAVSDKILTFPEAAALDTAQYSEKDGVKLAWTAARGAEGYLIERSDNQNGFVTLAAAESGDTISYTDESTEAGNRYQYHVCTYFTAEDGSRDVVPALNALEVAILPEPVELSTIAELKRENADDRKDTARVALSWDLAENVQSYAVYRSRVSDGAEDSYVRIAENITEGQYTDNTAAPDTLYSYKLIAVKNGLDSAIEKTAAKTIMTKPVLTALEMSASDMEIVRNAEQAFKVMPNPAHYPYEQELVWSAYDENGNTLEITSKNDTIVINGTDGKEILYISDGKIHAVCDSDTAKLTIRAAIDSISTECQVFVYSDNLWVNGVKDLTYTGGALTQDIAVYDGKKLLTEGVDYSVTYKNNVKVSTAETDESKKPMVIVKGKGSYTGTQTIYFEILPEPASDAGKKSLINAKVTGIKAVEYQGTAAEPRPVVRDGSKTLTEGTDYQLTYENNEGAGTATVLISGINDYKGTKKVSFAMNYNIQEDKAQIMQVRLDAQNVPYAKGGAKPDLEVWCGSTLLKEGTDYRLSYKNNKALAAASDKKAPTVVITGKGSYKGKREVNFNIVKQDIGKLTLTAKDKAYTKKAGGFATSFVITDTDGKKLSAGKDYDKASVTYTYADTGKPVEATAIVPQGTTLRITVSAAETGVYDGVVSGEYRITAYDIAKAKITVEAQTYTGSAVEPHSGTGVKVSFKGYDGGLTEGVHYEITGYENNVKKGTAKLYIRGIGDFGGTKTVKFKIKTRAFQWWWQN